MLFSRLTQAKTIRARTLTVRTGPVSFEGMDAPPARGSLLGAALILLLVVAGIYLLIATRSRSGGTSDAVIFRQAIAGAPCPGASAKATCFDLDLTNEGQAAIQLSCVVHSTLAGVKYLFDTNSLTYAVNDLAPAETRTIGIRATTDTAKVAVEAPQVNCT